MVADRIITPVQEPTELISQMLVVGKSVGDVRNCLDSSELNKAVQLKHFSVPTIVQLFSKLSKASIASKAQYCCSLDAVPCFNQISLSHVVSYLCTMTTPRGRFRYLRLPFGLKSAPEIYLQTISELFRDLPTFSFILTTFW